jgi:hypothetical protein
MILWLVFGTKGVLVRYVDAPTYIVDWYALSRMGIVESRIYAPTIHGY